MVARAQPRSEGRPRSDSERTDRRRHGPTAKAFFKAGLPTVAIIVALVGLTVVNVGRSNAERASVRAQGINAASARVLSSLVDAETGVRGYAATGLPVFLDPDTSARQRLPGMLVTLRAAVRGGRAEARVDVLERRARAELAVLSLLHREVDSSTTANGQHPPDVALQGKRAMDDVRREVAAISATETQASTRQLADSERLAGLAIAIAIAIAAASIGGLSGLAFALVLGCSEQRARETERRHADELLAASEKGRRGNEVLLASADEGISTASASGACTSINPAGARLLGYEPDELIGVNLHSVIHHHHPDGGTYAVEDCLIGQVVRTGVAVRVDDEVFWHRDGTRVPVEYTCAPLLDDGELRGVVVTFVDNSARWALNQQDEEEGAALRRALAAHQLVLHYQPKLCMTTGAVVGVEALARWQHPDRGLIPPDGFIPAATRAGVMGELTEFVIDEAARQHARWRREGVDLPVAVNIPTESLADFSFPAKVEAACKRHNLPASALELEITETSVMADPVAATAILEILAHKGFRLTVDDFGTGFSSFAYLQDLPVSVVKLDKSFVSGLPNTEADVQIVQGMVKMLRGLGKHVIAEGVETQAALDLLLLMGCDTGQGHFWSPALPAADVTRWIAERGKPGILSASRALAGSRHP